MKRSMTLNVQRICWQRSILYLSCCFLAAVADLNLPRIPFIIFILSAFETPTSSSTLAFSLRSEANSASNLPSSSWSSVLSIVEPAVMSKPSVKTDSAAGMGATYRRVVACCRIDNSGMQTCYGFSTSPEPMVVKLQALARCFHGLFGDFTAFTSS